MATDRDITTRADAGRESSRTDVAERERNLESRRESTTSTATTRRSNLSRRAPYFGTSASPFHLMRRMADDIERLFSDVDFARVGYGMQSPARGGASGAGLFEPFRSEGRLMDATWAPQLETFRREGKLVVRADLPGLTKDDIDIDVDDDVLVISGERSDEQRDERDDFYRSERTYGRFFRAIQLPDGVDADKIDATFKDGVLEVSIPAPKATTPRNRQIKIR